MGGAIATSAGGGVVVHDHQRPAGASEKKENQNCREVEGVHLAWKGYDRMAAGNSAVRCSELSEVIKERARQLQNGGVFFDETKKLSGEGNAGKPRQATL